MSTGFAILEINQGIDYNIVMVKAIILTQKVAHAHFNKLVAEYLVNENIVLKQRTPCNIPRSIVNVYGNVLKVVSDDKDEVCLVLTEAPIIFEI